MRKIIYQPWGGLGDNLAHSTIPEHCHNTNIPCYISKHNAYRSEEIRNFVWDNNPYLAGIKDEKDEAWMHNCKAKILPGKFANHIEEIQDAYGFTPNTQYPRIYYTPKIISDLKNKTLIDLSAHSIGNHYSGESLKQEIKKIIDELKLNKSDIHMISHNVPYSITYNLSELGQIVVNGLYHYTDILASAKNFITLYSGAATLAATVKNMLQSDLTIKVFSFQWIKDSCCYNYANTDYIILGP